MCIFLRRDRVCWVLVLGRGRYGLGGRRRSPVGCRGGMLMLWVWRIGGGILALWELGRLIDA